MGKILILTGDGGESYETLYAYHRFLEAGMEPVIAAPIQRRLHLVMHDFEPGWTTYVERRGYGIDAHLAIDDVRAGDYEAILVIGGRAPEYLRNNAKVLQIVQDLAVQGKWLFALCHGIQVFVAAGLVKDRRVTCYEHVRVEVEQAGGTWSPRQAVRDGRLVTAQTWESHPEFYREIFYCLREDAVPRAD